jgi:hypothetical protein
MKELQDLNTDLLAGLVHLSESATTLLCKSCPPPNTLGFEGLVTCWLAGLVTCCLEGFVIFSLKGS